MMKSKEAKEFIDKTVDVYGNYMSDNEKGGFHLVLERIVDMAVQEAEQEAEQRMRAKAHKIVKEMMGGIFQGDMPQKIADEFIQKLNDE